MKRLRIFDIFIVFIFVFTEFFKSSGIKNTPTWVWGYCSSKPYEVQLNCEEEAKKSIKKPLVQGPFYEFFMKNREG